ncbi:unnamed protein product [Medioppia subpectinata]|uniref:Uncharacterized protein n=1 Tax=Medioppia subpectinata TaxID=1979941 RepID=A0A7R9KEE9_9ACAR|nr:unnamed protein product [Medioppia subpectinata]CAG2102023.1 unnamed protein product [Medioppia subpectinata]
MVRIVIKLCSLGANVVITGKDDNRIQEVVNKCQNRENQRALGVRADKDIEELVAKTIAEFGKIDILVNNAAVGPTASFGDPEYLNSYDWVMNVNVRSVQVLTQLALPYSVAKRFSKYHLATLLPYLEITKGNIINTSNIAETIPSADRFPYHMSKCALNMFTKCLVLELGPKGVRVNCLTYKLYSVNSINNHVLIGWVQFGRTLWTAALERHCEANYPLRRIGEVEDVVEAVAYLASHKSSYITGAILPVDGGRLASTVYSSKQFAYQSTISVIGEGIAIKLWSLGANVVITGRDVNRIQEVVNKCQNRENQKALGVRADLSADKDIEELVAKTIAEFGKIDILVNNAAVGPTASFGDPEYLNSYDLVMNVNVRSVQVLTQLALPYLEITKGNIINISSIAGTIPSADRFPYHMSKCALNMFTKCLALGLGPKGVRVNCVTLGPIRSHSMDSNAIYKDNEAALERHCQANYPLRRIGEVKDVVEAVAYLASHKSSYITGAILPVDGGRLASTSQ